MKIDRFWLAALATISILAQPTAQGLEPEEPTDITRRILAAKAERVFAAYDRNDAPGVAALVLLDGRIVFRQGFGRATMEYDVPITPETVFHVASVSKQITAFAIAMLAEAGELSLDDDIRKHLPKMPEFPEPITIRHLIHHTSGLRDQWDLLILGGWRMDDVITDEHILTMARHQRELNFAPGSRHLYSNTGYTLLAEIVHRVTGWPFADWTRKNIFEPLGMSSTHFHDDHERIVENRAYSYQPTADGGLAKSVLNFANVGATGLFTTVEDLAKWMDNFDRATVGGQAVIERIHEEGRLNDGKGTGYAFGLVLGKHRGLKTVGHGGSDAGFRSTTLRFPDHGLSVIVLSNFRGVIDTGRLARRVAGIYLADKIPPAPKKNVTEQPTGAADPVLFDELLGTYVLDDGRVIHISRVGRRLFRNIEGLPEVELLPLSESRFKYADRELVIEFGRDVSGRIDRLVIPSRNLTGRRFEPWNPTRRELTEYVDYYFSDEVGTYYTVVIVGNRLTLRHRRSGDWPLDPIGRDRFLGQETVEFVRDDSGNIVGFLISTNRIEKLRFERRRTHPVLKR